jgi:hypothetical protein
LPESGFFKCKKIFLKITDRTIDRMKYLGYNELKVFLVFYVKIYFRDKTGIIINYDSAGYSFDPDKINPDIQC